MSTVLFTGGLGNQLFQYTFMFYLKEVKHCKVKYNISSIPFFNIHSGFEADKIFDFSGFEQDKKNYYSVFYRGVRKINKRILGKSLFCDDKRFSENRLASVYEGFWLNVGFYTSVKEKLKTQLKPLEIYSCDQLLKDKIKSCNSVFIHVRRGDYVNNKSYSDLSKTDYYRKAIKYANEYIDEPIFFVFSDDIEWCKKYFSEYPKMNYVEYENQSTLGDLSLMLACKHAIIANSSFSWWGAALDTKQLVIRPSTYFSNGDNSAMYPDEWHAID